MSSPKPTHLDPSDLGTKQYWDKTYTQDLTTHASTPTHTGQTWFEDVNASHKILHYLLLASSASPGLDKRHTSFLDLGTGNGEMLFLLREQGGFGGRMVGVDYSAKSVELCRRLACARGVSLVSGEREGEGEGGVEFVEWDVLRSMPLPEWVRSGFDVVLDKGTFDAVSLSAEIDGRGRRVCEGYREKVEGLVRKGGLVVVTSCNWTEEELVGWFVGGDGEGLLEVYGRVEYPVFRFGGVEGQSVQTVVFRRRG